MEHLFNSVVRVERVSLTTEDGVPTSTWVQATDDDPEVDALLQYLKCRLDMTFVRPGKDQPAANVAGRAPDRIGVMFTYPYAPIKAGDRIVTIINEYGLMPVVGTFEIRVIPDIAQDYYTGHHIEVQILETNQALAGIFPDDDDVIISG